MFWRNINEVEPNPIIRKYSRERETDISRIWESIDNENRDLLKWFITIKLKRIREMHFYFLSLNITMIP